MTSLPFLSRLLLLCLCGALLSGCVSSGARQLNSEAAHHDFEQALLMVQRNYVDEVQVDELVDHAIEEMYLFSGVAPPVVTVRDPLQRFSRAYDYLLRHHANSSVSATVTSEQSTNPAATDQVDIGLRLAKSGEWIRIAAVTIGSAAELAGLNRGDAIIAINGQPTEGRSLSWCYQQLSGEVGTVVEVTVNTEEGDVVDYRFVRTPVHAPHIVMLPLFGGSGVSRDRSHTELRYCG